MSTHPNPPPTLAPLVQKAWQQTRSRSRSLKQHKHDSKDTIKSNSKATEERYVIKRQKNKIKLESIKNQNHNKIEKQTQNRNQRRNQNQTSKRKS